MAVYTRLDRKDIEGFLAQYDIGELRSFEDIAEGISNSNYLVVTDKKYILTLFEKRYRLEDLPYFVALMQWWDKHGIHCPEPIKTKDGRVLTALKEKPAIVTSFLEGEGARKITLEHVTQLGKLAADMHIAATGFPHERANGLSLPAWEKLIDDVAGRADTIDPGLKKLISEEYNYLSEHWPQGLPGGPIHADLFPDNVFFNKAFGKPPVLSGVIDCYFACNDFWAYDLAICANAWCFDERHRFVPERATALMAAYTDVRPLELEEEASLPLLLRGAALRFLLTRSYDMLNPEPEAVLTLKDPMEYVAKLRHWQETHGVHRTGRW